MEMTSNCSSEVLPESILKKIEIEIALYNIQCLITNALNYVRRLFAIFKSVPIAVLKGIILLKGHFVIYKKTVRVCKAEKWHMVWMILDAG